MTDVIAVPANPALVNSVEDFLHAQSHGKPSASHYVQLMDHMTDRLLSLLLAEPAHALQLSSGQQKVVDFAISTAGKASHMLTRQIYGKLDNRAMEPIAAHVRAVFEEPDAVNGNHWLIRFPVAADFASDFRRAADACEAGNGCSELAILSSTIDRMTDYFMEALFLAPTRSIKLGFITQKALNVGIEGSRKALHAVNHKVLKSLNDEQLKTFMGHYAPVVSSR